MKRTWRWFGKQDKITLSMLKQIGVEGIVTALHDVPLGEVWTKEAIHDLKTYIENEGLVWSVVESLPVTETIKYGGKDREQQLQIYEESLRNLASEGIKTVCYNFMPVLDWARTDLHHPNPNGTTNLYFSYADFALFDIHILARKGAREEWQQRGKEMNRNLLGEVNEKIARLTAEERHKLIESIVIKTQGFVSGNFREDEKEPLKLFHQLLARYEGIDKAQLRNNLQYFLERMMPVCNELNINLCIHPDDPPIPVFGLPRIMTNAADIAWLLKAVDNPHNGLTFCAGSLSAGSANDVVKMARDFASRTHFLHLRSCHIFPNGDFQEASHLGGRGHLAEIIPIFEETNDTLPMRIDHGMEMLGDEEKGYNAGYSFHGRMLAMGQVQGMLAMYHAQK